MFSYTYLDMCLLVLTTTYNIYNILSYTYVHLLVLVTIVKRVSDPTSQW